MAVEYAKGISCIREDYRPIHFGPIFFLSLALSLSCFHSPIFPARALPPPTPPLIIPSLALTLCLLAPFSRLQHPESFLLKEAHLPPPPQPFSARVQRRHFQFPTLFSIFTSRSPGVGRPLASRRWMKRYPCCRRSRRMQAHAARMSVA